MRLTKQEKGFITHTEPLYVKISELTDMMDVYKKLGQLEDIEEELGIDLVTLFKALKNGIHAADGDTWDGNELAVSFKKKCLCFEWYSLEGYSHIECFYFKDYGKTWALTKEELE